MREQDTPTFLDARERKLVEELALIRELKRAYRAWQENKSPETQAQEEGNGVARESVPDIPPTGTIAAAPAPEPPPFLSEEERMKLLILAGGKGRGAIQARVELLVADCGETFSIRDVLPKYHATYGKDRYRLTESISSALWKLARKRGYPVMRAGAGTHPTVYRKQGNVQTVGNAIQRP